ncbi:MAG: hypothetical protein ACLFRX_03350 [Gemmatimonadota bacterium]
MRRLRLLAIALLVTAVSACARGVTLNPDAGTTYAISVVNELTYPMIISFDDGEQTRLLGTVGANREERFVLAGASRQTVTVIATDEADTRTVRRTVTLSPGATVDVRIN